MKRTKRNLVWHALVTGLAACWLAPVTLWALPPAPPNDLPGDAEVIGPDVPVLVYGTTVLAANDINSTPGLPAIDPYVDGPDVFYSFTPNTSETFRIHLLPWYKAPLRSSDRRFTIYIYDDQGTFLDGIRAPGNARAVYFDVALTSGIEYTIGVDHDDITHDNFPFTLMVDALHVTNPDNCATAETLPGTLPVVKLNDIDGALHDFTFVQGSGRCAVSGTTPTTAPGIDHVYLFTPPATGDYALELVGSGFDAVLYVNDSCPPDFPTGCLGASNHSTSGSSGGKHELVVVTLEACVPYYVYVDNGSTSNNSGGYALIIDDAFEYEINELEPNESAVEATPLTTPLNGGQIVGPGDVDWYAVTGQTGDRVYAWVNNGGSANSTLDTDLAFYAANGVTLIEFDDEDGDGADAPIEDLRYVYSTTSPVIAGAQMTADGTHYFEVTKQYATGTVHRYRLHVGVEPATRAPLAEVEPNDSIDSADYTGKHYYAGVIPAVDDSDFYAFDAEIGDRVFVAFDGDPERDSTGDQTANEDPNAFHGKLVIYDPDGDVLISDISDSNSIQSPPDYPAQGGFFVARTTGTHYVEVKPQSSMSQVGPTETYELAIFLNDAAPDLAEDMAPVVTLTPDYANDLIHGEATDNEIGDTGVCDVLLYNETNLQITNPSAMPAGVVTFDIELVNPAESGIGKLLVTDCAGNTACQIVLIDIDLPTCDGYNFSERNLNSLHDPLHVPDNDPAGIYGEIEVPEPGLVSDVNVTVTVDALDTGDLDIYLVSPTGTTVELVTDRMSSLGIDMLDTTFDDDADEILPILGSAAPYTGTWLPEDPLGLAKVNGEEAQGTWRLNVIDDNSNDSFGATLVRWSLDIEAGFAGPETFAGTASDLDGESAGIESIVLTDAVNVELNLPPEFTPGDLVVEYTVTLIDPAQAGSGTVTVTDLQQNTCQSVINLNGVTDANGPDNTGAVTTDLTFKQEVQQVVPESYPAGVVSTITVPDSFTVGEVEVALMVDSDNQGRMAAKLTHNGEFASLVNRIGMDDRGSSGNTKNSFDVLLDDDAPQADDIHEEPALGSIATLGLHQPDGRGEYFGDGITADKRDNMLFTLAGLDATGDWELLVADTRMMSSSDNIFRRWALTLKNPCGPERYVGRAVDLGTGIQSIELAVGASNLFVVTDFTPGDVVVDYRVELSDPALAGNGTLEITDLAANTTQVPIQLVEMSLDVNPPIVSGAVNPATYLFEGTATDNQAGDSGIYAVELAPFSDNLEIQSITPDPPNGAASVDFVVRRIDTQANARGYVRVTDGCGWRSYILVEIDALGPACTGSVGTTKRYVSTHDPLPIPDNDAYGVVSSITVPDPDIISDVNITLNITHPYDDDIDLTLLAPTSFVLFNDIGGMGNDFIDTTLDDEAAGPIPDSSSEAPFTGSYQCEAGPTVLAALDGVPAAGDFNLRIADDAVNNTGTFDSWSVTIESPTFPERYDGRAEDGATHDTGICSFELLPGAAGLVLTPDLEDEGAAIWRYSVELAYLFADGTGTVRVTDCAGNYCDVPVALNGIGQCLGDSNCDGEVNWRDIDFFVAAMNDNVAAWEAMFAPAAPLCPYDNNDVNGDGTVNWRDIDPFVALINQPCPQ
ncbi:MAG: proprotein convertase P-domain-containing protein [Phycisphaerae bacterium]|nr:proprotein convertase P-domain-containing protein [Phycisphaerae bacterium]